MSTQNILFDILNGPSAGTLVDALKYAYDPNSAMRVRFTFIPQDPALRQHLGMRSLTVMVTGVRYESGAAGMFLIRIAIENKNFSAPHEGFYNANTRKGHIEVVHHS